MNNKTSPPQVQCNKCAGTGSVALGQELFETLQEVRRSGDTERFKTGISAVDLAKRLKLGGSVTAVNNRLEELRRLGFLTRNRNRRKQIYKPIEK